MRGFGIRVYRLLGRLQLGKIREDLSLVAHILLGLENRESLGIALQCFIFMGGVSVYVTKVCQRFPDLALIAMDAQ